MLVLGPKMFEKGKRPLEEVGKMVQIQERRDVFSLALALSAMELGEQGFTEWLARGPCG